MQNPSLSVHRQRFGMFLCLIDVGFHGLVYDMHVFCSSVFFYLLRAPGFLFQLGWLCLFYVSFESLVYFYLPDANAFRLHYCRESAVNAA